MVPTASRLRLALVTVNFVCALALSGIIVQKPHGGLGGAVPLYSIIKQWPVKYLDGAVPLTGVIVTGGFPR
jgi:hypothetical protein